MRRCDPEYRAAPVNESVSPTGSDGRPQTRIQQCGALTLIAGDMYSVCRRWGPNGQLWTLPQFVEAAGYSHLHPCDPLTPQVHGRALRTHGACPEGPCQQAALSIMRDHPAVGRSSGRIPEERLLPARD